MCLMTESREEIMPSKNVFEDLGFAKDEARDLKQRADAMGAIREYIEEQGYTQKEVAKITGLTQPNVSNLLTNKIDLFSLDRLVRVAKAFDAEVTVAFMFPDRSTRDR